MVPSTLGMCRYISHSEIVCRGPKKFENPCSTVCLSTQNCTHFLITVPVSEDVTKYKIYFL